ncbi:MAG: AAA family ATPase [Candidatus Falkowbacteria bacterium]|nr:AAA family ATPase [Candidatus Falkowbacteria bacterium]
MYLEKLEVQGFKSFANKNKLIFSGLVDGQKRGLTAIVGPNGSGKSNVADAIRWALGEQSLKVLRGKKSEDIIFSGSDQKSQLSLAEVSLYLNNAEANKNKTAAPETIEKESDLDQLILGGAEIIITRRLYRNGESEYLLNNNRVRLADIQMLLAKANFGQKTYSVIGQGMVENFLSSSAADRKDFFDEATGVKQFQIKRDSSLNKLENSYENLQQVDMLLAEIKPRLKSLTRQVEKLKRRGEIENKLKGDQLNYYGYLWQDINKKLDSFNTRLLAGERLKLEREKKLNKLNEELNKIRNTDNFREINELTPRLKDLEAQKNQYLKQLAKLQAELEVQFEAQGQFDVSWLNNKQGELSAELENVQAEIAANEKGNSSKEEESLNDELKFINQEITKANEITKKINQLNIAKDQYLRQISKLEAILEANLEIQGQFDVSWLNNKKEELSGELEKLSQEINQLRSENNQTEKINLENKLGAIQEKLGRLNEEINKINKELKRTSAAGDRNEEISRVIDELLKQLDVIGQESDLNRIKKMIAAAKTDFQNKIQALISGGNGDDIQRIKDIQTEIISLTEDRQSANNRLNEEKLRLATINERRRLLEEKEKQTNWEITDIIARLDRAQTKFDASKIADEKSEINKKIAALEKEINALSKNDRLAELNDARQTVLSKIQDYRLKASARSERLRLLNTKKIQSTKEIEDIKIKISKSQLKFDAGGIKKEKEEITEKLDGLNAAIKKLENELEELNRAKDKEKAQLFEYQKNIQAWQAEVNEISGELSGLKIEATRQETRLEDLEANIRGEELNISEIKEYRLSEEIIDINLLQKHLSSNKSQLEQIGGIDPEAEKEYQETKERYDFLSGQMNDLDGAIKSLEEIIYELDVNIKNRFDAEFKVISEKFNEYFKILFNGGNAKIYKLMTEDLEKEEMKNGPAVKSEIGGLTPAEAEIKNRTDEKLKKIKFLKKHNAVDLAGVEVQATPPGKKIQTVTMLSGGERALTAIALICAIISANPSPFVVLDEVDAALDEANSERLARILDDLSNKTQFIIITHNRASMRKASILYGVAMEADGISRLLSVKLDDLKNTDR